MAESGVGLVAWAEVEEARVALLAGVALQSHGRRSPHNLCLVRSWSTLSHRRRRHNHRLGGNCTWNRSQVAAGREEVMGVKMAWVPPAGTR